LEAACRHLDLHPLREEIGDLVDARACHVFVEDGADRLGDDRFDPCFSLI